MKSIAENTRKRILEQRQISKDLKIDLLRGLATQEELNSFRSEIVDQLTNLPVVLNITPRRILRSHGQVKDFPNVQPRTIEYKPRENT